MGKKLERHKMKTELTFIYKRRRFREIVRCQNPSNAGAVFLAAHPNLDRSKFDIINCVGLCAGVSIARPLGIPTTAQV